MAFCSSSLLAQSIKGKVVNQKNNVLQGVNIYWLGTNKHVETDQNGEFEIEIPSSVVKKLIASYAAYSSDTIEYQNQNSIQFRLSEIKSLDQVVIKAQRDGISISDISPIKTEQISQTELKKAACCDLAGCFETQVTVQPQTTNVITNSKELRILGLSGVYNQVLVDGFPMIQALTYTYGISSIPGSIVDNIYISKGANSVLQGFESISGQINVETKDPDKTDKLYLNAYVNNFLEKHLNANYSFKKNKWSNLTAIHSIFPAGKFDRDHDQFLDVPKLNRIMLSNKWKYGTENGLGWYSSIGFRFLNEKRVGGQVQFSPLEDRGSTSVYGQVVGLNQPEVWTKTAYRLNDVHRFVAFASSFYQQQNSYFGTVQYDAKQTNLYINLQHEYSYKNNDVKYGVSHRLLSLDETIHFSDTSLKRTYNGSFNKAEKIAGLFAENTMKFLDNTMTWIAGVRLDHHNQFGLQWTPRTLLKYDIRPKSILRLNVGTGWRTINLFSENINLLVSSRNIVITEELKPEKALNYGINFTQKFETEDENWSGYISCDYYRTSFQNQIFPDYDSDPTKAIIKNFTGTSVSNGFQLEASMKLYKLVEFKTGYNYLDVFRRIENSKISLPFNPRHKILTTLSYNPTSKLYHIDLNVHWYGKQRLADTKSNPSEFRRPDYSDPYTTFNIQFTYNVKSFELYTGCENLFDFRQLQPIISWQNPFSQYFDTSSVWGPTRGREIYFGLRYRIKYEE